MISDKPITTTLAKTVTELIKERDQDKAKIIQITREKTDAMAMCNTWHDLFIRVIERDPKLAGEILGGE